MPGMLPPTLFTGTNVESKRILMILHLPQQSWRNTGTGENYLEITLYIVIQENNCMKICASMEDR